ncbi:MAG TPA: WhiB family transcriptional regulator [Frankiaceae bacterium]|jgi:WhiB family redox-sensing transcriptional regulator|nr:WhiB family transcriptional regulator [Frankiaceae bacterium]
MSHDALAARGDALRARRPWHVAGRELNIRPEPWTEIALCLQVDPEMFFPERGGSTREAKRICTGCDVRTECLTYALEHTERFGIWGGLSERERRRILRAAS